MDLILWRHADAEEGADDLARKLTAKGEKQAARVAKWLRAHLPDDYALISSPALRAHDTARALSKKITLVDELAPGASVKQILAAANWPRHDKAVVLVGHQPDFGRAVAYLVSGREAEWSIKKGGLWWIGDGGEVRAVVSPNFT